MLTVLFNILQCDLLKKLVESVLRFYISLCDALSYKFSCLFQNQVHCVQTIVLTTVAWNMAEERDKNYKLISGYCRIESHDMNIVDGIVLIIFEYHKFAKWSKKYKGENIFLEEDDSKAVCSDDINRSHSIRADFSIERGTIISWEFEIMIINDPCNFFGVILSNVEDFNNNPFVGMKGAYGLDDGLNTIYFGANRRRCSWKKPIFPLEQVFRIRVVADWKEKQCKLTFYYNEKKLNDDVDDYTMLLPELDDDIVLYPSVTPYNKGAYCIIRYV